MLSVKAVDIVLRVKTSVHDKLGLSKVQDIQILKEIYNVLGIRDISGEFTVVKGQAGFFAKNKDQIDLWKPVILKYQEECDGQQFFVCVRKALFQVGGKADAIRKCFQQVSGSVVQAL